MKPKITLFYYNNINTFEEISDLDKCPISQGIWCLYGCKNNTWTCLQVARSTDITAELRSDIANITEPITLEETPYLFRSLNLLLTIIPLHYHQHTRKLETVSVDITKGFATEYDIDAICEKWYNKYSSIN